MSSPLWMMQLELCELGTRLNTPGTLPFGLSHVVLLSNTGIVPLCVVQACLGPGAELTYQAAKSAVGRSSVIGSLSAFHTCCVGVHGPSVGVLSLQPFFTCAPIGRAAEPM